MNRQVIGLILSLVLIVAAGFFLSRWQPAIPQPSTAIPASRTPTATSSPLPPTVTTTTTPTATPDYAAIDATVLADNITRTPEPPTPATNPATGGALPNIGGILALSGVAAIVFGIWYTRIKKS